MSNTDFYKTGKIDDYLSMKENPSDKEKKQDGTTDKSERDSNKTGTLR